MMKIDAMRLAFVALDLLKCVSRFWMYSCASGTHYNDTLSPLSFNWEVSQCSTSLRFERRYFHFYVVGVHLKL